MNFTTAYTFYTFFLSCLTALSAAVLVVPQWGNIGLQTPLDHLLSVQLAPYWVGGTFLAMALLLFGLKVGWLHRVGWSLAAANTAFAGGLVVATAWESHQILTNGHWGMSNLYEVSILLYFILGALGLATQRASLNAALAVALTAIAGFALWLLSIGFAGPRTLMPALESAWLPWHVLANFIGYGAFFLAGLAGMVLLLKRFFPQLNQEELATIIDRCVLLGFPVFTVAILLGCAWAAQAWGAYWSWDPKETWALITWLTYAAYLHARHMPRFTPQKKAVFAIIGFFITLFCFLGVNMFLSGLHSYGTIG